ncbi:hypothetical protein AGMMS49579_07750 [Spirochaetia bacterium]|nr:hypothetical protein AGMMS49579_07750 [Spirochaetia bacterium]
MPICESLKAFSQYIDLPSEAIEDVVTVETKDTLVELIESDSKNCLTQDEAFQNINNLLEHFKTIKNESFLSDIYRPDR